MRILLPILIIVYCSCNTTADPVMLAGQESLKGQTLEFPIVKFGDSSLQLLNGTWYYRNRLFNGVIERYYPDKRLQNRQTYLNGKEEGWFLSYFEDGSKDALRYYHLGEKDSVHRGWWPNGNLRYEYHYKQGLYQGSFREWYASGKPLKQIEYASGKEERGMGWRENGKLYMNFVVKNNRIYGIINPNLCYSLKNEKGEYVSSSQ